MRFYQKHFSWQVGVLSIAKCIAKKYV